MCKRHRNEDIVNPVQRFERELTNSVSLQSVAFLNINLFKRQSSVCVWWGGGGGGCVCVCANYVNY